MLTTQSQHLVVPNGKLLVIVLAFVGVNVVVGIVMIIALLAFYLSPPVLFSPL
jgi:hypothetical protein